MILRTTFVACIALGVLAAPLAGAAQTAGRVYGVGYLSTQSRSVDSLHLGAFRQALRDLGYVEGQNLRIESRYAEGKVDRLAGFAAELVRLNVDVMITGGSPGTRAAQKATGTIPLIMTVVGDPIELGFVAGLGRPGGNVTGLTQMSPQLTGKRLELLKEAFPRISRVAVLVDAVLGTQQPALREARAAAETLGIRLQMLEVRGPRPNLDETFRTVTGQGADAVMTLAGPVIELHRKRVVELLAMSRLPAIYPTSEFVEAGGLMSYGPDRVDLYRRAAGYVGKILRGAKPADLPVEQPTKFEFVINLKTAKALGVTIPQPLLLRADQVLE